MMETLSATFDFVGDLTCDCLYLLAAIWPLEFWDRNWVAAFGKTPQTHLNCCWAILVFARLDIRILCSTFQGI